MVELLIPYARPKTNIKPASSATPPEANDPFLGENKSLIILNLPCVNVLILLMYETFSIKSFLMVNNEHTLQLAVTKDMYVQLVVLYVI